MDTELYVPLYFIASTVETNGRPVRHNLRQVLTVTSLIKARIRTE